MKLFSISLLAIVAMAVPASACFHFGNDFPFLVKEGTREVLIFHDGTNAHLVLSTDLQSQRKAKMPLNMSPSLPDTLAWVIALPSVPSKYEELKDDFFEKIKKDVFAFSPPSTKGADGFSGATRGGGPSKIIVHKTEYAGNYEIEPIEIKEAGAGDQLNAWLKSKDYKPIDKSIQAYYLKPGATFLALKLKLKGDNKNLRPLHIVYASPTAEIPLKLTHADRTFSLDVYVATHSFMKSYAWEKYGLHWQAHKLLSDVKNIPPEISKLLDGKFKHLTMYNAYQVNTPDNPVLLWKSDPYLNPDDTAF